MITTTTRTARNFPVNAALQQTINLARSVRSAPAQIERRSDKARNSVRPEFDYGPISRDEMRDIVLEMIG